MSSPNELKLVFGLEVNWITKESGVALGVWLTTGENAPVEIPSTMMAHRYQKTCFTKSSELKTQIGAELNALGELSSNNRRR
jgi:hypothetical protein